MRKKIVLITGANGLLGKSFAKAFSEKGYTVVISDIIKLKKEKEFDFIKLDVTKEEDWVACLKYIISKYGYLDVLVNNAGTTNNTGKIDFSLDFTSTSLEQWNNILNVNLNGVFLGCKHSCNLMKKQGQGVIINISSMYGVVSPNHSIYDGSKIKQPIAYSVSKSGVISLTKFLATLMAHEKIRINCISPGGVFDNQDKKFLDRYNNLSPLKRLAKKEEISSAVTFLASDEASNIIGHNLIVDGGWTVW